MSEIDVGGHAAATDCASGDVSIIDVALKSEDNGSDAGAFDLFLCRDDQKR